MNEKCIRICPPDLRKRARQGIGMLRFLSKYLPRHTLNEMYIYVRPHLDYGDVTHPAKYLLILSQCCFDQPNALAVTVAWKGTSCDKLHDELGWESLISHDGVDALSSPKR